MSFYGYALHVHHEGPVIEVLTEPIENRIAYIRAHKPASEQETRLRLLRQLTDKEVALLPKAWVKAYAARVKAYAAWTKADAAWDKADAAWTKADAARDKTYAAWIEADAARVKARPELEALHARICVPDCPWDGKTIASGWAVQS